MLKVDLHIHTKGDPVDVQLEYTPMDVIKRAAKLQYDALAITWHNKVFSIKSLKNYAKKKGITLIQGTELSIEKRHTLVYNITQQEASKIKTLHDLEKIKDHTMIGAAHPFYMLPSCLGNKVIEHNKLFDFIEHSHFYTKLVNPNKKAHSVAKELKLPIVANSDIHHLELFGKEHTMINAENTAEDIIETIKKQRNKKHEQVQKAINIQTKPYTLAQFAKLTAYFAPKGLLYTTKQLLNKE